MVKFRWLIIFIFINILGFGVFIYQSNNFMANFTRYVNRLEDTEYGVASWYAKGKHKNGTPYYGKLLNCASNYFPRYSLLLVENRINNKRVLVWNNDVHEATDIKIDLSKKAFLKISKLKIGKISVKVTFLCITKYPNPNIFGAVQGVKK